jgi:hypothetical protein
MVHGVLHCGYRRQGRENELLMRSRKDEETCSRGTVGVNFVSAENVSRGTFLTKTECSNKVSEDFKLSLDLMADYDF